ncbi:MAG: hypothetical protein QM783_08170 [Phycisphaerales bacterium]
MRLMLIIAEEPATSLTLPTWLPWALVGVGVVLLAVVGAIFAASRKADTSAPRDAIERAKAAAELADLKNQLVEVKRLAAAVADDLDRRAERLERLIADADGLIDRAPAAVSTPRRLNQPAEAPPIDDLTQRIFTLADQGKSAVQIAQALRQPVGNIELMLALRGGR